MRRVPTSRTVEIMRMPDELLLLAYDDDGTALAGTPALDYALAGAVLAVLAIEGRIDLVDGRVAVRDKTPSGDEVLDGAFSRIAGDDNARKPTEWVSKLSADLREKLLDRQVAAGILRREEGKVLWVFPRTTYPCIDDRPERELRERLQTAPAGDPLVDLVVATDLGSAVFGADRQLSDSPHWTVRAVRTAIDEMQAAIAIAATTGAVTTIVTGGNT
jgi:hypothetical protein